MVAHSSTLTAEDSNAVSLVHHDRTVVLVLQFDNLRQLCKIALHGEYAIDNNKLDGLVGQLLEYALQVFHVIMLVVQLLGKRKSASVDY